ncbi:unnamed protein product [Medioppia subpectinata]|uniref:Ecdysone receptor n=1 Tax=Medioppia subpectinata TaxID=1979941 RepID=A0A7R9L115_9ACAR|nr:unnamed protein product [Medioppia subpectinata]CAG2113271.1 unnamed protein product [Medioppia subpectinata]
MHGLMRSSPGTQLANVFTNEANDCYIIESFGAPNTGPALRQQRDLCLVCGDRAHGVHYYALTCQGCSGFFRQTIRKKLVYECIYGNNCEIDMYMRTKCRFCRFKKCLDVGMCWECVGNKRKGAVKRIDPNVKQPSTDPQKAAIDLLVYIQDEFDSPSETDINKVTVFAMKDSQSNGMTQYKYVIGMTVLTVKLTVEFSKQVPGFGRLLKEDKITLLKACSSEVMFLRASGKYDTKTRAIIYASSQPYTREDHHRASVGHTADALFGFCRLMSKLNADTIVYALITAIVLFSERPNLLEPKKVEFIQQFYIKTLEAFVYSYRSDRKCYFAKLLGILTKLRTLANINSESCLKLKDANIKLPPFLAEVWDIEYTPESQSIATNSPTDLIEFDLSDLERILNM